MPPTNCCPICKSRAEVKALDDSVKKSQEKVEYIEHQIDANFVRLGRVEELLAINSAKIDTNSRETSEILSLMREGEAFFKFSKKIGDVLKWTLGLASAVAVFWASVKGWKL